MVDSIEYNEVNHFGVKPAVDMDSLRAYIRRPDDFTQITNYYRATNESKVLYTVTAGKTFYLNGYHCNARNLGAAQGRFYFSIYDNGGAGFFWLVDGLCPVDESRIYSHNYTQPFEVPAGYQFRSRSYVADLSLDTAFYGYEL